VKTNIGLSDENRREVGQIFNLLLADSEAFAARFKGSGTADFLTRLMERNERAASMLRAKLETEEDVES
jgi:hypothetical protein